MTTRTTKILKLRAGFSVASEWRQLVLSDRFLFSVLESAFDAVLLVDRTGCVVAFNPAAESLFEKTQEEAIALPVWNLGGERWKADALRIVRSTKISELMESLVEIGGRTKSVEISVTPVYDKARTLVATSLIVRDVSARLRSEEVLRTSEKLAAVGCLASSIAHEINNPLEAVTNLLYLCRRSNDLAEIQLFLDMADQELRRVSNITNQTLRFHRQSVGPVWVACGDLLQSVVGVYKGKLENSGIRLEKRIRPAKPICCLEGEVRQVLNNLVGNAMDAMHGSGGRLLLRSREATHWRTGSKGVMITVGDTGTGMSAQTAGRVFEPFFTTKGHSGTGLGLWISHEIVQRHGGDLRVRSSQREGRSGTVFTLFLPFGMPA